MDDLHVLLQMEVRTTNWLQGHAADMWVKFCKKWPTTSLCQQYFRMYRCPGDMAGTFPTKPQWNTQICLPSSVLHELYMMPDWEIHHIDMSKILQSSYLIGKFNRCNTKMKHCTTKQKRRKWREKTSCPNMINIWFIVQRKHCMTIHSCTFNPSKELLEKDIKNKLLNPWLQNLYGWHA